MSVLDLLETTEQEIEVLRRVAGVKDEEGHINYSWQPYSPPRILPCYLDEDEDGIQELGLVAGFVVAYFKIYLDFEGNTDIDEQYQMRFEGVRHDVVRVIPVGGEYILLRTRVLRS